MKREDLLQIKVCGMRDPENLEEVCELVPDYIGFIFYPPSKRFVGFDPDHALFMIPGTGTRKTGVFVNEDIDSLRKNIAVYGLEAVQLHGAESPEYCKKLSVEPVELIKVLDPGVSRAEVQRYMEVVDLFLFDSAGAGFGGSGRKFDWGLLDSVGHSLPFFLSGGIGPGDSGSIHSLDLKGLIGVDVNSRFELSPGMKDVSALKKFITEIRK